LYVLFGFDRPVGEGGVGATERPGRLPALHFHPLEASRCTADGRLSVPFSGADMNKTGSVTKDTSPGAAGHGTANKIAKSGSQAPLEGANQPGTHYYGPAGNDAAKNG
jgi:hypothetical protein